MRWACELERYFESIKTATNMAFVTSYRRRFPKAGPTSADAEASYLAVHLLARARKARPLGRSVRSSRRAPSLIAINAPQGEVHVDRDNRHCYLTPRIGVSNAAGGFDIIYEAARPVQPDPYLVWQEFKSRGNPAAKFEGGQVTRHLIQNFRGVNALVIHGEDRNRAVLTETLTKLGLKIHVVDPSDASAIRGTLNEADIVVFDTDMAEAVALAGGERIAVPVIAIVGLEAPGRLQRAFELEPSAILYKPLRSTGIYSALFFATNEHRRRHELVARVCNISRAGTAAAGSLPAPSSI